MIKDDDLIKIISEFKSGNINYFINNYSFSDRKMFVDNMYQYNDVLENNFAKEQDVIIFLSSIFSYEEARKILVENEINFINSVNSIYISLFTLPDEEKKKYLHYFKYDTELFKTFVNSFADENVYNENVVKGDINLENINKLNDTEKIDLIRHYSKYTNIAKIISSMNVVNIITYLKNNKIDNRSSEYLLKIIDFEVLKKILFDRDIYVEQNFLEYIINKQSYLQKIELLKNNNILERLDSLYYCKLLSNLKINDIIQILKNIDYKKHLSKYDFRSIFNNNDIYKDNNEDEEDISFLIELYQEGYIDFNTFKYFPDDIKVLCFNNDKLLDSDKKIILSFIENDLIKTDLYFSFKGNRLANFDIQDQFNILKTLNDDNKLKLIKIDNLDNDLKIKLTMSLSEDNLKFDYLDYIEREYMISSIFNETDVLNILKTLNDENKRKYILQNKYGLSKTFISDLISSLQSSDINDKFIIDNFEMFLNPDIMTMSGVYVYYKNILFPIKDVSVKIKLLEILKDKLDEQFFISLITNIKYDDLDDYKIKLIKESSFELTESYVELLKSLNDVYRGIEILENNSIENSNIIYLKLLYELNSKYDELKINFLNNNIELYKDSPDIVVRELIQKIIDSINVDNDINKLKLKIKFAINYKFNSDFIYDLIIHNEEFIDNNYVFDDLILYCSKCYNCDYERLLNLISKYGNVVFRFLNNKNIISFLNLDQDNYNKIKNMFDFQEMIKTNDQHIDNVLSALLQKKFTLDNKDMLDIFISIKNAIISNNIDEVLVILNDISSYLCNCLLKNINLDDDNYISNILRECAYNDINAFIKDLYDKNKIDSNLKIINKFTNKYILEKRNDFVKNNFHSYKGKLLLDGTYEKKSFIRCFIEQKSQSFIIEHLKKLDLNKLTLTEKKLLDNEKILFDIISLKKGLYVENKDNILKFIKTFNSVMDKYYLSHDKFYISIQGCKLLYNIPYSKEDILSVLSGLDINLLKNKLLNDDKLYSVLIKLLKKYKLVGWGNTFYNLSNEVDLEIDNDTISSFINNFYNIYPTLVKKNNFDNQERKMNGIMDQREISLTSLLNEALVYASCSFKYSKLLGKDDFKLIKSNPTPNSAPFTSKERLNEITTLIKDMYLRNKISIPPLNEKINISGKNINVLISNSVDMTNVTMGERTGSCMRIKGHAYSLFKFCLTDVNGFHIKFVNDNGKFVSRVSGFRNGNTVFLNQLRYSLDENYSNDDLISSLKIFSEKLIEETKNDIVPLDNVVISNGYAMESLSKEKINLGCSDIKKGLSSDFYSDIVRNGILLATSGEDFIPIRTTQHNEKLFDVSRQSVNYTDNTNEIIDNIDKFKMISDAIGEMNISSMSVFSEICEYKNDISSMYFGEDWYIVFDKNNNILDEFIIDRGFNKEFVYNEMNGVKNNIMGAVYEKNRDYKKL